MGFNNSSLEKLYSQISNLPQNPNIQVNTYDSLQRYLARFWQRTFGVKKAGVRQSFPGITSETGKTNQYNLGQSAFGSKSNQYSFLNPKNNQYTIGNILNISSNTGELNILSAVESYSYITRFLVIAVHGTKLNATTKNLNDATSKNVIYLANHVYSFPQGTTLSINTPKNSQTVTVKCYRGCGVVEVNEDLFLEVMDINSAGTDYEKNYNSFPYLEYSGKLVL